MPVSAETGRVLVVYNRVRRVWDIPGGENDHPYVGCWKVGLGEDAGRVAVREAGEEFGPELASRAWRIARRTSPDVCIGPTAVFHLSVERLTLSAFRPNREMACAGWMFPEDVMNGGGMVSTLHNGLLMDQPVRGIARDAVTALVRCRFMRYM